MLITPLHLPMHLAHSGIYSSFAHTVAGPRWTYTNFPFKNSTIESTYFYRISFYQMNLYHIVHLFHVKVIYLFLPGQEGKSISYLTFSVGDIE
ncbi:hypothetical protein GCM10007971_38780 [Oceanobacillus indicireducens]|uniref:Uncharacterized protein n=1 Tax=Oceanobacillus indicireducens TaxID=1004261 RepID=A0A917Y5P7_9BACI|nr:hypothetical protein GCM10007971_38780 [Oceanobacillus indicireducens]